MSIVSAPTSTAHFTVPIRRDDLLRKWLPLVVILGLAVVVRHFVVANTDVSWDITLSEKILDGQRLYIDLIEVNPPATVFLYLPAVALARALGWAPEIVVDALVFLGALVSLGISSDILRRYRSLDNLNGWSAAFFTLAVLTILPAQTFGEREHIALIAVLPALAVLAARAKSAKPLLWHCLVAGAGAGVTICIKPHFALALVLAAAAAAHYSRSWRTLLVMENWMAVAIAALYGICVVIFCRAFITDVMPEVVDVYLPVRLSLVDSLISMPVILWTGAILVVLGLSRGTGGNAVRLVLLMASAGFAAAFVIQGKGWGYQSYPMLALVLIALDLTAAFRRRAAEQAGERGGFISICAIVALYVILYVIAAWSFAWFNVAVDTRAAAALVRRVAPPHPSIVVISDDGALGHPLVRMVGGRWISSSMGLWVTLDATALRIGGGLDEATDRRLATYLEAERQRLIGEIRDGKPDIIILDQRPDRIAVDGHGASWSEWVKADRDLSALAAANYREAGSADGLAVLKRNGT